MTNPDIAQAGAMQQWPCSVSVSLHSFTNGNIVQAAAMLQWPWTCLLMWSPRPGQTLGGPLKLPSSALLYGRYQLLQGMLHDCLRLLAAPIALSASAGQPLQGMLYGFLRLLAVLFAIVSISWSAAARYASWLLNLLAVLFTIVSWSAASEYAS